MAKLDKKYAPFVEDAKKDYIAYCDSLPEGMRNLKKAPKTIKYYDALLDYYGGKPMSEIAEEMGVTYTNTARNTLSEIQNRVRLFVQQA